MPILFSNKLLTPTQSPRKGWILFAMCAALSLTIIDHTGLIVALPSLQYELNLTTTNTQWVMNSYLLTLSAILLFGGKTSDTLGHRRTFLFGITLFIVSSILSSAAQNGSLLLCARALQGIGAAFMVPTTSAIIAENFSPAERPTAIGIYIATSGLFLSLGPLLGGLLTQYISWRALFWINLPLGITSILLTLRYVPSKSRIKDPLVNRWSLDWLGLGFSILFTSGPVLCLMMSTQWRENSQKIILILIISLIALLGFLVWEPRAKDPLLNLKLFKNKPFSFTIMTMLCNHSINIIFIFWAQFLQKIGWSPVASGVALLPVTLPIIIIPPLGKHLLHRFSMKNILWLSNICIIASLIYIGFVAFLQKYTLLFPGFALFGIMMPCLTLASRSIFLESVELKYQGTAGAIAGYARQLGTLFGSSLFTAVFMLYQEGFRSNFSMDRYMIAFQWVMWTAATLAVLNSFPISQLIRQQTKAFSRHGKTQNNQHQSSNLMIDSGGEQNFAESLRINKLRWHCRRGMLELDTLLQNFVSHIRLSPSEEKVLVDLLLYSDQVLYQWIIKQEPAPTSSLQSLVNQIRNSR